VAPGGRILAGVLPAKYEKAYLRGFAPSDCTPITGDGVNLPLCWKGGALPPYPTHEPLEIRLTMEKATLFSYTC